MEEEKKNYGKTLNLPKTEFPMRGNLANTEPEILQNIFAKNKDRKTFILHDGPPYANRTYTYRTCT